MEYIPSALRGSKEKERRGKKERRRNPSKQRETSQFIGRRGCFRESDGGTELLELVCYTNLRSERERDIGENNGLNERSA